MTKIMIVEDNSITRKMVHVALTSNGFTVIDAPDAATALDMFPRHEIALVLQDLVLPDSDGIELVRRLRALPRAHEVPILAFSGLLSKGDEARFSAAGFDDVIVKPIEPSHLIQIVRAHLPTAEPSRNIKSSRQIRRRLVLADDDPVQRKLAVFRLQREGYEVTAVADGQEALERARTLRPDAIVSDVLMPRLDGFGLCLAIRNDPELAGTPIVLVTNSYLEAADRELARRTGANDMVLRTPDFAAVLVSLTAALADTRPGPVPTPLDPAIERERVQRVMNQLERQVALNAGANQRSALLAAELSVLSAISEAVASNNDVDASLRYALAACFDAGGISMGAMYLDEPSGRRVLTFGPSDAATVRDLTTFFEQPELLDGVIASQQMLAVPSPQLAEQTVRDLLARGRARSMLLVPLGHRNVPLGALLMVSHSVDLHGADRVPFASAVGGQISLALAIKRAFDAKDASEHAARENATTLRSILDSIADAVVVTDEEGAIRLSNPAADQLLRARSQIYLPDQVTPLMPEQDPLIRAHRGAAIDRAELYVQREASDGRWLSVNARPLPAGGGVAVYRDVTVEKTANTQLMISDRMASLGTLAAGVGHEINNPLTAVIANIELAVEDLDRIAGAHPELPWGELPDELRDAKVAAGRVREIVRDLKLFSRVEEDKLGVVDVVQVIESSLRMAWTEIRHRAVLKRDFQRVRPVLANEARLGQIVLNLIINAAHAIAPGDAAAQEIRIATEDDGDFVRIAISDTGAGMSPDVLARLFTPFFTTKPVGVGTGLGLAICQRLVEAVGGKIAVSSILGAGSTFTVYLPATKAAAPIELQSRPNSAKQRGRVLVIDDEAIIVTSIQRSLAMHEVIGVTEARVALDAIASGDRFDVIFCDLMMPTITGMAFYDEVRRLAPEQLEAIVFVTGGAFIPTASTFLAEVSNRTLEKPFEIRVLTELVDKMISRRI